MGYESYITVKMLTQPTFPGLGAGEAILKLEAAMLGALDLSILDEDPKARLWSLQGRNTTAEQITHALGEIADRCGTTVQIDYCNDVDDGRVQTYYVGPGAALQYAADHVKAVVEHLNALAKLVETRQVTEREIAPMLTGTGIHSNRLFVILDKLIEGETAE